MARYTANQMRVASKFCKEKKLSMVAAMLRQAAALQKREERKKKKWEYAERTRSRVIVDQHYESMEEAMSNIGDIKRVVRREVGEWEEVPNV